MEAGISDVPDAILNSVYVNGWITLCTVVAFWLTRTFSRRSILICGTIGHGRRPPVDVSDLHLPLAGGI